MAVTIEPFGLGFTQPDVGKNPLVPGGETGKIGRVQFFQEDSKRILI
jgi:hypothetical protein